MKDDIELNNDDENIDLSHFIIMNDITDQFNVDIDHYIVDSLETEDGDF